VAAGRGRGDGGPPHGGRRRFGRRPKQTDDPSNAEVARGQAIGLLSRRDLPRRALKGRLTEKGFEAETAEAVVSELEEERLVSDERFVTNAVLSRAARGQGPVRIMLELRRLGVDPALVAEAVDPKDPDWTARAIELRRRRFGPGAPKTPAERAKQLRLLLYRGFTGAQVRAVTLR
jgi:regulatory protein